MTLFKRSAAAITALSLAATPILPAMAANVQHDTGAHSGSSVLEHSVTNDYRRRSRHRHHDRVDGGDILAGIGILAGIAILAGAANKNKRDRSNENYPETYPDQYPPQNDYRGNNDIGSAVSACSEAAESQAGSRIDEIDSVNRDGNGWRVDGELSGGDARSFSCVASNGNVESIQFDDRDD